MGGLGGSVERSCLGSVTAGKTLINFKEQGNHTSPLNRGHRAEIAGLVVNVTQASSRGTLSDD